MQQSPIPKACRDPTALKKHARAQLAYLPFRRILIQKRPPTSPRLRDRPCSTQSTHILTTSLSSQYSNMRSLTAATSPTPTLASLAALTPDALKLLALSVPSIMYLLYRMCEMDAVDAARCTQDARTSFESPVRQRRKSSTSAAASRRRSSGAAKAKSPSRRVDMDDLNAADEARSTPAGPASSVDSVTASPVKSSNSFGVVEVLAAEQRRPFVSRHVRAAFATRTDSGLDILTTSSQSPVQASATIVGPSP